MRKFWLFSKTKDFTVTKIDLFISLIAIVVIPYAFVIIMGSLCNEFVVLYRFTWLIAIMFIALLLYFVLLFFRLRKLKKTSIC